MSNLNRQVFANLDTVGREKAAATADAVKRINPEVELEVMGGDWVQRLGDIAARYPVIVNGCDDVAATVQLYRVARQARVPVIDAYASPLPSVILVGPDAPRPEERLGYPTRGKAWDALSDDERRGDFLKELEYVLTNSSSAFHVDLGAAAEMAAGKRSRMSFAPMVITTGNLMAYEALQLVMGRPSHTDHRGWSSTPTSPASSDRSGADRGGEGADRAPVHGADDGRRLMLPAPQRRRWSTASLPSRLPHRLSCSFARTAPRR